MKKAIRAITLTGALLAGMPLAAAAGPLDIISLWTTDTAGTRRTQFVAGDIVGLLMYVPDADYNTAQVTDTRVSSTWTDPKGRVVSFSAEQPLDITEMYLFIFGAVSTPGTWTISDTAYDYYLKVGEVNGVAQKGWWRAGEYGGGPLTFTVTTPGDPGPQPIPEPATILMLGAGLAALARASRRSANR